MKSNTVLSKYDRNRLSELLNNLDKRFMYHSISSDGTIKFFTGKGFIKQTLFNNHFTVDFIELVTKEIIPMITKKRSDDPSINNELIKKILEIVATQQYDKAFIIQMLYSYYIDTRSPQYLIVLGKSIVQIDNRAMKKEFTPPDKLIEEILQLPRQNLSDDASLKLAENIAAILGKQLI